MPPDSKADLAHPETADWVLGTMGPAQAEDFQRHLTSCLHCQAAVAEFGEIGQMLQHLPPAAEPPPGLEARTIASVLAAAAKYPTPKADRRPDPEDQAATRVQPRPQLQPAAEPETQVQPRPQLGSPPGPQARPVVTRLPAWRRNRGRLAAVVAAAAAAITGAIAIPLSLLGSGPATVIPLAATTAAKVSGVGAAAGQATARQDASGSWNISLTVHHLKNFEDAKWYECWYIGSKSGQRQVAPVGSFLVSDSSSQTFTMTSAVDPHDFKTMVITLQPPSADGAFQQSNVILSGHTL